MKCKGYSLAGCRKRRPLAGARIEIKNPLIILKIEEISRPLAGARIEM